ncbi:DUF1206 domain-containing protein [Allonocardiopsis opalescens]|uniref:Uncharacterized protein DUF1206 n=1 Tax=Allonocardiopsis opalescens TaxID=1144618 RepID=A0A2T0Q045_9ACTN|nr:DUF1206 domain-containing protein [Allonocardiopsis opalescens]PRX97171.1 uncharacterized protein DUF1206 [Allonocardiopsis opalescens]
MAATTSGSSAGDRQSTAEQAKDQAKDAGRQAKEAGREAREAGREASRSRYFEVAARVGLAGRGLLFLMVGLIAVQIAAGGGSGQEAETSGALRAVAATPGGVVALAAVAVGLLALTLWQLAAVVFGDRDDAHRTTQRIAAGGRLVVYAALCVTVVGFLLGSGGGSQDQGSEAATAQLMALPFGQLLVGAAGLALIGTGFFFGYQGVRATFTKDLRTGAMSPPVRAAVVWLGRIGHCAKGVVAIAAGVLVVQAAITFDPERAEGVDGSLRALAAAPFGPWVLGGTAAGLAVFGVFCFCEAYWARR